MGRSPLNRSIDDFQRGIYCFNDPRHCIATDTFNVLLMARIKRLAGLYQRSEILVESRGCFDHLESNFGTFAKLQCVSRPMSDLEIGRNSVERKLWCIWGPVLQKNAQYGMEAIQLWLQRHRDCLRAKRTIEPCFGEKCFISNSLLFSMLLSFLQQLSIRFLLLNSCTILDYMLPHEGDRECPHSEASLCPSCPFALRYAEGAVKPAAVVDWICHATVPVNSRAIVCGGMA